ncbi:MAG: hypothetical protein PHC60_09360 [Heliobacteriaceae bacterium]|nr:hypothetical protein [Heliobacteriaceae bacterium]MDD4588580.1 hypothetical protein [Heliobacteriaceae bacterium]
MADGKKPPVMKQSRAKLWIRTGILIIFGSIFGLSLYHDILSGIFRLSWAGGIFLPSLVAGFWMSRLVPMQIHTVVEAITFSFDRIYFFLILFLVIMKTLAGRMLGISILADIIMCIILGMMLGRLSGICLRVSDLKKTNFSKRENN